MAEQNNEIVSRGIVRQSNEEAKRITKECIEIALIKLLEKKDYEKISITEIVQKAGVSRTAFYSHYNSKEDVLRSTLTQTINDIILSIPHDDPSKFSYWSAIFARVDKIKKQIELLLKSGLGTQLLLELNAAVTKNVGADSQGKYKEIFIVGAIFNVLISWILGDKKESAEDMARICAEICKRDSVE